MQTNIFRSIISFYGLAKTKKPRVHNNIRGQVDVGTYLLQRLDNDDDHHHHLIVGLSKEIKYVH